jgi:hypothetical protein
LTPARSLRSALVALVVDVAFVLLFATIGRISHTEGVTVGGVAGVAGPFLVALLVGWGVARRRSGWPVRLPGSGSVWLVTVLLGLLLRVVTGGGFAWSFGLVTLLTLGLFLIGWRCAAEVVRFAVEGLARWADRAAARR